MASARPDPIPLVVLTGFLGAGKTTLLNELLKSPALAGTAALINEFGEIGLDHLLVRTVESDIVMLTTGCICCTVRGELVGALEDLTRALDNGRVTFNRVVLETTGLADPAPVLHTIMAHPYLLMRYRLEGVITLVDAMAGGATLDRHRESVKQAAIADRLVITKTDLLPADDEGLAHLRARLRALNPAAPILDAAKGEAAPERLLDCGLYDPGRKTADVRRWLAAEAYSAPGTAADTAHDDRVRAVTFSTDKALTASAFDMFLELLRALHGPKLLRVKGILKLAESPDTPTVIHGVQHIFHPPAVLPAWPDEDRRTRIVIIGIDLEMATIDTLFRAFAGDVAPDRPDLRALADNPLVPFGGADR